MQPYAQQQPPPPRQSGFYGQPPGGPMPAQYPSAPRGSAPRPVAAAVPASQNGPRPAGYPVAGPRPGIAAAAPSQPQQPRMPVAGVPRPLAAAQGFAPNGSFTAAPRGGPPRGATAPVPAMAAPATTAPRPPFATVGAPFATVGAPFATVGAPPRPMANGPATWQPPAPAHPSAFGAHANGSHAAAPPPFAGTATAAAAVVTFPGALPTLSQQPSGPPRPPLDVPPTPMQCISQAADPSGVPLAAPSAMRPYVCVDTGNASPRYVRLTTRLIASTSSILDKTRLPLAGIVTPFADPEPGEYDVSVSEWSHEQGPVRCARCRGFLNCFVRVQPNGAWQCNMCGGDNQVSDEYATFLHNLGGRVPAESRFGSVEYLVSGDYVDKKRSRPLRSDYVFLLDASAPSLRSGLFSYSLHVLSLLAREACFAGGAAARVGVVTYDEESVTFFACKAATQRAHKLLIINEADEGFAPVPPEGFMVAAHDVAAVDQLHALVRGRYPDPPTAAQGASLSVGGTALAAVCESLRACGGRVVWLVSSLPSAGQGRLIDRDQQSLVGRDEEATLYGAPKDEQFFNSMATRCAVTAVGVDVIAAGAAFVDLATLAQVPSTTGGTCERIAGFSAANAVHRGTLHRLLTRCVSGTRAMDVTLKVRTSTGLKANQYRSHGLPEDGNLRMALWTHDMSMSVELEHDGTKLEAGSAMAFVQVAALFTSPVDGSRRLRTHTVALAARDNVEQLTASFDSLAVALFWAKVTAQAVAEHSLKTMRSTLVRNLMQPAQAAAKLRPSARGLSLPENQELLPLFVNAMLKSSALVVNRFKDGRQDAFARADARVVCRYLWLTASPERFAQHVYPAVYDVSDPGTFGDSLPIVESSWSAIPPIEQQSKKVLLPRRLPASSEFLRADGIYLVHDGGDELDLFIGPNAPRDKVDALLGGSPPLVDRWVVLVDRKTPQSSKTLAVARQLLRSKDEALAVNLFGQLHPEEIKSLAKLVEDKIYLETSYASFLAQLYTDVQTMAASSS